MVGRRRHGIGFGLVLGTLVAAGPPALAEQFQCMHGDVERRVELNFAETANRLPCKVLYWRNVAEDAEPRVLWRAEADATFCIDKTKDLIARLEDGGWRCTVADEAQTARREAEPRAREDDQGRQAREPEAPSAPVQAEQEQTNGQHSDERQREALRQSIERDLERLNELTASSTGRFSMDVARFGDLDRDGVEDAAVVMTYRAGSDVAHYLVAYLFDGSAFRPAAKAYLGGSAQDLQVSEIEPIDDGAIRVRFAVSQPGDGRERAAFVLENGELIEAPTS